MKKVQRKLIKIALKHSLLLRTVAVVLVVVITVARTLRILPLDSEPIDYDYSA